MALVLDEKPGLSIAEYEDFALALDHRISRKSVGNELRRGEGQRYKRDRPGGYRWFPINYNFESSENEAAETPRQDQSAASLFNKEEANAAALVS